ncbi:MAG: 2-oxoglutarate dehydrogenase E1 component, partial [Sphingobacteriales bacterium]
VDPTWSAFFEGFELGVAQLKPRNGEGAAAPVTAAAPAAGGAPSETDLAFYGKVVSLVYNFRALGHTQAHINPLSDRPERNPRLNISQFGFTEADMDREASNPLFRDGAKMKLRDMVAALEATYSGFIGFEFTHIHNTTVRNWVRHRIEAHALREDDPADRKSRALGWLIEADSFENFLGKKFLGEKRFSLEGGEGAMVVLNAILEKCPSAGVLEIEMGMAHRGRLNILANFVRKSLTTILYEFTPNYMPDLVAGDGDVKYHLGFSSEVEVDNGKKIHLKLCPNPSHLETVGPVVIGFARSKADVLYKSEYDKILPILIHGDASVAGQGVVYELLQMSGLKGYYTGGTIHYVINNQIGFTTDFDDARSADYSTSVAGLVQAPVLHVNGDDAEAVVKASQIATLYRQEFNSDIFIDMVCYRRHGHNEGDEPKFTQPQLYAIIDKHANPREVYTQYLIENGEPDAKQMAKEMEQCFLSDLQERLDEVKQNPLPYSFQKPELWWRNLRRATEQDFNASPITALPEATIKDAFEALMKLPEDFKPLRKVDKLLQDKLKAFAEESKIDWATAELLAYASLIKEGKDVRMSGQDVKRGTFSSRHAVLYDEATNSQYNRLSSFSDGDTRFRIYNSLLSEYAVLGFEYGYSMANPNALVLWEAQFGDFVNGAQIIVDQYLCSAETKWQRMNGLVLLLPHGYEGQGPEHS